MRVPCPLPELPITPHLERLISSYLGSGVLVLTAEPGAGKTTLLPLALGEKVPGKILLVEPRRLAAATAAKRMASLLGEETGVQVGFHTKWEKAYTSTTQILAVTEGILVNYLLKDPLLEEFDAVIFDEFHERSASADLALALLMEARRARPGLGLVIMSATLNTEAVTHFVAANGPTVSAFSIPGRQFPVTESYLPPQGRERVWETAAQGVEALWPQTAGDVLVFLPGVSEIEKTRSLLLPLRVGAGILRGAEILTLYGQMDWNDQKKVLEPSSAARRVILATSIAETSLTLAGVTAVVDSGWSRFVRYQARSGMNQLVTERICRDTAEQRKGRAGRQGPGLCLRLWSPQEPLLPSLEPEIQRSELSALVLAAASWGSADRNHLAWYQSPPAGTWEEAAQKLQEWEALDSLGKITALGTKMLELGIQPRLARLALSGDLELTTTLAAILSEGDFWEDRNETRLDLRVEAVRRGLAPASLLQLKKDLLRRLGRGAPAPDPVHTQIHTPVPEEDLGMILAAAYPDRVARLEEPGLGGKPSVYQFPSGRRASLPGTSQPPSALVAPSVDAGEATGRIWLSQSLDLEQFLDRHPHLVQIQNTVHWSPTAPAGLSSPRITAVHHMGSLVLKKVPLRAVPQETVIQELDTHLKKSLNSGNLEVLPFQDNSLQFRLRCQLIFPDWNPAKLLETWKEWLLPYLSFTGPLLTPNQLLGALRGRLDWAQSQTLERECPTFFDAPSGQKRPIHYSEDSPPTLSIKLQELFGLAQGPRVAGKPVRLELLSPAGRPVQITEDLVSFWKNTYPEVKKDLKGRYPKHPWPDDPWTARATHRLKKFST